MTVERGFSDSEAIVTVAVDTLVVIWVGCEEEGICVDISSEASAVVGKVLVFVLSCDPGVAEGGGDGPPSHHTNQPEQSTCTCPRTMV